MEAKKIFTELVNVDFNTINENEYYGADMDNSYLNENEKEKNVHVEDMDNSCINENESTKENYFDDIHEIEKCLHKKEDLFTYRFILINFVYNIYKYVFTRLPEFTNDINDMLATQKECKYYLPHSNNRKTLINVIVQNLEDCYSLLVS